jgi:hypothetical protein
MPIKLAVHADPVFASDELFDVASPLNANRSLTAWALLREAVEAAGGSCHTADVFARSASVPEVELFMDLPRRMPARVAPVRWLLLGESAVVNPRNWDLSRHAEFERVFTWHGPLLGGERYVRLNYPAVFSSQRLYEPGRREKLCAIVAADKGSNHPLELYSERRRAIRWFEEHAPADFDLWGHGWERPALHRPRLLRRLNRFSWYRRGRRYPSYRGACADKFATLNRYRFSLCFENARDIDGYITEKLFDCLLAGTVPVYRGAPDIDRYVPGECFIDLRRFASYDELYRYLQALPEREYRRYLEAGAQFLASPRARPFTPERFVQTILGELTRVAACALPARRGRAVPARRR